MKLVTYNIRYSLGRDGCYDLARIARAVEGADIIALQEVERGWLRTGQLDQPYELGADLRTYHWVYGPAFDVDGSSKNADGTVMNQRRQFGVMLLSKTPILSSRLHLLPKLETLSHLNYETGAIEGVIDTGAGPLRVYSLHLSYLTRRERLSQIETLLEIQRRASVCGGMWSGPPTEVGAWGEGQKPPPMPQNAILMGDFNSEPDTPEYTLLAGEPGQRVGQVEYTDRFVDAWRVCHPHEECFTQSAGADPASKPPRRVDYCFVSPSLKARLNEAWVDTQANGSDHQPCWFDLDL